MKDNLVDIYLETARSYQDSYARLVGVEAASKYLCQKANQRIALIDKRQQMFNKIIMAASSIWFLLMLHWIIIKWR